MNKATSLALAGLMAVASVSFASEAKNAGYGNASLFIASEQNSFKNLPQAVSMNKDVTYFELGTGANKMVNGFGGTATNGGVATAQAAGGVQMTLGPGVLGLWVGEANNTFETLYKNSQIGITTGYAGILNGVASGLVSPGAAPAVWAVNDTINKIYTNNKAGNRVDLLYGMDLNDKVSLGVGLNRANNNVKNDDGSAGFAAYDASNLGLSLGADIKEVGFKLLQVGVSFNTESQVLNHNNGSTDSKFDSNATGFGLRVGGDVAGDKGAFGRMELGLGIQSGSVKNEITATSVEDKASNMIWNAGYAMGKSGDKGMGLCGLKLSGANSSDGDTDATGVGTKKSTSKLDLAFFTAGEAKVKEWLTARAGLSASLFTMNGGKSETATVTTTSNQNGSPATASVGLGINLGDVTIDGVLNQDLLYTGSYLISGVPDSLFSQVSLTWNWE